MGGYCGYLALMGGLSGGAVRVYLHEEGITLKDLAHDVERMVDSFRVGQRLFLTVMNEKASPMYTSDFLCRLFEQESQGLFDAREVVLGQTQQGGSPARSTGSSPPGWPRTPSTGCSNQIDTKQVRQRGDRAARGQGADAAAAPGRGAGRLGAPAPARPVVAASCGRSSTCWPAGSRSEGVPSEHGAPHRLARRRPGSRRPRRAGLPSTRPGRRFPPDLEKVDISTLVIHGDDDQIVSIGIDHLRSE